MHPKTIKSSAGPSALSAPTDRSFEGGVWVTATSVGVRYETKAQSLVTGD